MHGTHLPAGVAHTLGALQQAWNQGDARAYAGLFTEDATYVIYTGQAYCGRAEIERGHEDVFSRWQKGSRLAMRVLRWHALGDGAAVVLTEGGVGKSGVISHDKLQTFTMQLTPAGWRCAAFHNTKKSRLWALLSAVFKASGQPASAR